VLLLPLAERKCPPSGVTPHVGYDTSSSAGGGGGRRRRGPGGGGRGAGTAAEPPSPIYCSLISPPLFLGVPTARSMPFEPAAVQVIWLSDILPRVHAVFVDVRCRRCPAGRYHTFHHRPDRYCPACDAGGGGGTGHALRLCTVWPVRASMYCLASTRVYVLSGSYRALPPLPGGALPRVPPPTRPVLPGVRCRRRRLCTVCGARATSMYCLASTRVYVLSGQYARLCAVWQLPCAATTARWGATTRSTTDPTGAARRAMQAEAAAVAVARAVVNSRLRRSPVGRVSREGVCCGSRRMPV
jgi:hypothetical protein